MGRPPSHQPCGLRRTRGHPDLAGGPHEDPLERPRRWRLGSPGRL